MKKWFGIICMMVLMGLASTSFALDPILVGDEFAVADLEGWTNGDGFNILPSTIGVTSGTYSMKIEYSGGWGQGPWLDVIAENLIPNLTQPNAVIGFDVSSDQLPGWGGFSIHVNCTGFWGDLGQVGYPAIGADPVHVEFKVPANVQALLSTAGYASIAIGTYSGGASTLYVDNIQIYPDTTIRPHDPNPVQVGNVDPALVDVTLQWSAAADPNSASGNAVNPDIVDQYVFLSLGGASDPNVYYVGNTGVDPGTTDPASSYVLSTPLPVNSTYYWAVVEAMDGYTQSLTVGDSIDLVDPNNIVGPVWAFDTLTTNPVIDTPPVSLRWSIDDPAAKQFTVAVTSLTTPLYQWFYSADNVIDPNDGSMVGGTDEPIAGETANTITFSVRDGKDQGYYYCRVANNDTVSGGGTLPDVYSDAAYLIVECKVAEYLFDGNLLDTSTLGNNGTGVGSPTFVTGVGGSGSALSLSGSGQYVQIAGGGWPNAGLTAEGSIGGGLDKGSIICWVKSNAIASNSTQSIMSNFQSPTGWPPSAWYGLQIWKNADGADQLQVFLWGADALQFWPSLTREYAASPNISGDSQWHLLAATWDINDADSDANPTAWRYYIDGNLLASGNADPSTFGAFAGPAKIGANGWGSGDYWNGLIDNLRTYNYRLTSEEIAQEYYNVTGGIGCINPDFSDFNANRFGTSYCKIDLADFVEFATAWLSDASYTPAP